jgi:glycosyltransferase involved in cell wall biosynthesis/GT2 family glycosyltransferase
MRICIITKFLPPKATDGIPRNRWEYANQFQKLGHEVHIITSGVQNGEQIRNGIFIHEVPVWDDNIYQTLFYSKNYPDDVKNNLCYSYLVYQRIKRLDNQYPLDLIESPLWDIEGYITKLELPHIPMVLRLETTSMLMKEILDGQLPKKDLLNEIESDFIDKVEAYVFDSWSILKETERLYNVNFSTKPYAVIYHGITTTAKEYNQKRNPESNRSKFKLISVGRLEKRKGTDILVKTILPKLLTEFPDLEMHIVGKDNAEWDGFRKENGCTYTEYIATQYSMYLNKSVHVYGYVSDAELDRLYESADAVLALSRYESFGLLYVEAMNKCKPIIAFETGAVPELFEHEKDALLIPFEKPELVVDAVKRLHNPEFRNSIGNNAYQTLIEKFAADRMGKECSTFFEKLILPDISMRIYQIMNCLTDRDGVSNITIEYDNLLKKQFNSGQILGTWSTDAVRHLVKEIESQSFTFDDTILYHYWNYCERGSFFNNLTYPAKIFLFHNVTTPSFFERDDEAYLSTSKGFAQLPSLDGFDIYAAFSNYSVDLLKQAIAKPIKTFVIPPLIDKGALLAKKYDTAIIDSIKTGNKFQILFVGSIAPHKKQEDLVYFFNFYLKNINPDSHLYIAGGGHEKYVSRLKKIIQKLGIEKEITITGKITDEELYSYYRIANLYLSMSEHEGFGVPLVEAMIFNIPVVAYSCTAIPETIGITDCLFDNKNFNQISDIIEKLRSDEIFRQSIIKKQEQSLTRYSAESVKKAFEELLFLAKKQQKTRLHQLLHDESLSLTETIYFNNEKIQKSNDWQLNENEFLYTKDPIRDSYLSFNARFTRIQFNCISHEWSGKIKIIIDDTYEEIIDLFSINHGIKNITIDKEFPDSVHKVSVLALLEANPQSKGREIFFKNATLYCQLRKYTDSTAYLLYEPDENEIQSIPFSETQEYQHLKEQSKFVDYRLPGAVLFSKEIMYNSDILRYHGQWETSDEKYQLSKDSSGKSFLTTNLFFTRLSIKALNHSWSGTIRVTIDDKHQYTFNLFNYDNELKNIEIPEQFDAAPHEVKIELLSVKDKRSFGHEFFFQSITASWFDYARIEEENLKSKFKVSVVINTLNRGIHLKNLLEALTTQTYKLFEVIVVNGPSTDSTDLILAQYKDRIKIGTCDEANLSKSRNIGINMSSGDWIAFIDDDALPGDDYWIESFVNYIILNNESAIGIVGGPVKHRNTENYEFKEGATSDYANQIFLSEDLTRVKIDGERWIQGVRGANNIILKEALYKIGGFDERFVYYLDETDVCFQIARSGYKILNHPTNYVRHYSGNGEFRKSQYDLKWDVITRSDTYFCLKTGRDNLLVRSFKTFINFKKKHFYKDIINAYLSGSISKAEFRKYRSLMIKGLKQGYRIGLFGKKNKNYLDSLDLNFKPFHNNHITVKSKTASLKNSVLKSDSFSNVKAPKNSL